ncbi:hypothetical protein E2C01_047252 [Portunus trituberculatus]|uniref:Uncharacterized protein n=1 Tax=Portunus trituberculatus TaxID=210409 RepID=A0A5B7G819_PORTR|nr:hypothetical protein [Portunus trituberculatus]
MRNVIPVLLVLPVILVSEWYSGICKKGDDRALHMTKCATV